MRMLRLATCLALFVTFATRPAAAAAGDSLQSIACPDLPVTGHVTCWTLSVAENPAKPAGRRIPIRIMVLRAASPTPDPDPLFVIPGGPGQSIIAEAGLTKFFAELFAQVRETRDVVFVDQRGTGGSNPLELDPPRDKWFVEPGTNMPPAWGRAALARLERKADLTQYTTARAVEDLDAVRRALGYEKINLYGTSYGTRVVEYYIKRHGSHVRTAVLKAVLPPGGNIGLGYGRGPQRSLELLFALCAHDSACAAAYPHLRADLDSVLTRLETRPVTLDVPNPGGEGTMPYTITRGAFAFGLRSLMMSASVFPQLPALIAHAARGDFSAWAPFLARERELYATRLFGGMSFSVLAAEDAPRLTEDAIRAETHDTLIGDTVARDIAEIGRFWPRGAAPADLFTPLETLVPVLLVSGMLDPATPPAEAEAMLTHLPNGGHVVYPGGSHSGANYSGLDGILTDFIRSGSVERLDIGAAEANRLPPFATGP